METCRWHQTRNKHIFTKKSSSWWLIQLNKYMSEGIETDNTEFMFWTAPKEIKPEANWLAWPACPVLLYRKIEHDEDSVYSFDVNLLQYCKKASPADPPPRRDTNESRWATHNAGNYTFVTSKSCPYRRLWPITGVPTNCSTNESAGHSCARFTGPYFGLCCGHCCCITDINWDYFRLIPTPFVTFKNTGIPL